MKKINLCITFLIFFTVLSGCTHSEVTAEQITADLSAKISNVSVDYEEYDLDVAHVDIEKIDSSSESSNVYCNVVMNNDLFEWRGKMKCEYIYTANKEWKLFDYSFTSGEEPELEIVSDSGIDEVLAGFYTGERGVSGFENEQLVDARLNDEGKIEADFNEYDNTNGTITEGTLHTVIGFYCVGPQEFYTEVESENWDDVTESEDESYDYVTETIRMSGSLSDKLINGSPWIGTGSFSEELNFYSDGTGNIGSPDSGENFTWYSPNNQELVIVESHAYSSGSGGLGPKRVTSDPGTYQAYIDENQNCRLFINNKRGTVWSFDTTS